MRRLLFLGTGHGMPVASTSSSLLVQDDSTNILLDVAGGHDIIGKFFQAKQPVESVQNIFISHYDSDHILGIVPIIRAVHHHPLKEKRRIFCSEEVRQAIKSLFHLVARKHYAMAEENIEYVVLHDKMEYSLHDWKLTFFDVKSNKSPQFGCTISFSDGKRLAFLGDEPLRDHYIDIVQDSDVFIHEAFCLDKDQEMFEPHEKNHSTVKECALNGVKANAGRLVLFHMEDKTLMERKETYYKEAKSIFPGDVFVPVDLDSLEF